MTLNGTCSVVCFKDVDAAERCAAALQTKGATGTTALSLSLEALLTSLDSRADGGEMEVCLVDRNRERGLNSPQPLHVNTDLRYLWCSLCGGAGMSSRRGGGDHRRG